MRTPNLPTNLRSGAARTLAIATVLSAPAVALAAEPVADAKRSAPASSPERAGAERRDAPLLPNVFAGKADVLREIVLEMSEPIHPVAAKPDYGDALAAFGHARGRPHEGQDIFAPTGTRLRSPMDTVVVDAGTDSGRGNWVALYDPERKLTYSYFHLNSPATVEVGEKVDAGQTVGEVGCTGSCYGDHLHFELREGRGPYGTAIDPMPFLTKAS